MENKAEPGPKIKRTTPGRSAKQSTSKPTNKRKQPEGSPGKQTRIVKAKLAEGACMATPITLEMLRNELADNNKVQIDQIDLRMLDLSTKIAGNSQLIMNERNDRKEELRLINERIDKITASLLAQPTISRDNTISRPAATRGSTREDDEYQKYKRARKSLIFYPIEGETTSGMMPSLQNFITRNMKIPVGEIKKDQIELVRRIRSTRNARAKKELLVLFTDMETRDFVLSHAKNLSSFRDTSGKPTAGVRMDVPTSLLNVKKALDQYGYTLRTDLGEEFKRNTRYDDANRLLVMDIKYPGDKKWQRINYEQAIHGNQMANATEATMRTNQEAASRRLPPSSPMQTNQVVAASTSQGTSGGSFSNFRKTQDEQQQEEVW